MQIKYSLSRVLLTGTLGILRIFPNGGQAAANSSLAEANNAFALDLFKQATKPSENAVFSPYSISAAFAMAYAGAAGDTASQMQKVMHWSEPASKIAADFTALDQILKNAQKSGALELSIANTLWPQKGYAFQKDYLALLEGNFKTALHEADFAKQPEAERSRINQWVQQQTRDRIKDLLPPGSVSPLARGCRQRLPKRDDHPIGMTRSNRTRLTAQPHPARSRPEARREGAGFTYRPSDPTLPSL